MLGNWGTRTQGVEQGVRSTTGTTRDGTQRGYASL